MFIVVITPIDQSDHGGKLADVELYFTAAAGALAGLRLMGFSVCQVAGGRFVTYPACHYTADGERRHCHVLRPIDEETSFDRIRQLILDEYAEYERAQAL